MTDANEALRALILEAMRAGYEAGHHWTVEGGYSEEWADDNVDEWIEDCDLVQPLRAHLTDPGYVRVPVAKCPDCDDNGWYVIASPKGQPMECQCEFCHRVPNSLFNVNSMLAAAQETSHE